MRKQTVNRLTNKATLVYSKRREVWGHIIRRLETEQATCGFLKIKMGDKFNYCILGILEQALIDAGLIRQTFNIQGQPRTSVRTSDVLPDWNRLSDKERQRIHNKLFYPFSILLPAIGLGHWANSKTYLVNDKHVNACPSRSFDEEKGRVFIPNPLEVLPIWKKLHDEVSQLMDSDNGNTDTSLFFHVYRSRVALIDFFVDLYEGKSGPELTSPFLPTPFDSQPWDVEAA